LYVKKFETEKQTLGNLTGVNAFLTAIFNMRQNSIPLLDVSKGILEMVRCCETMKTELTTVLDSL